MSFRRKDAPAPVEAVIAGLGNPGQSYRGTRHNIGFMAIDALAGRLHTSLTRRGTAALVGQGRVPGAGADALLVKPQTFMNLSGKALAPLLRSHGRSVHDLWVIHDDIDLAFGRLRIRRGGGSGGHNGIASVIDSLGGQKDFVRLRMGVGRPLPEDAVDYVLATFPDGERERLPAFVDLVVDAVVTGLVEGLEVSMNRFNGRSI